MLYQINVAVERQFLFYYIAVLLGIEIAMYCFYYYYKMRDVYLKLNRILLSIGAFTLLTIFGALLLVDARLFEFDPISELVMYKSGFAIVFFAPIGFMYFIYTEELNQILNLRTSKILMILNLIPIVAVILFSTENIIFRINLFFMVLDSLYVVLVQIRLIRISIGDIKKRLKQFFAGEVLALIALVFAAQVSLNFFNLPSEPYFYIGTIFLISGFVIIFISTYKFPPFYEFEWKENLLRFLIINQDNNRIMYSYDFSEIVKDESLRGEDLKRYFSGRLMGLEEILSIITHKRDEKLTQIKHGDALILLEYSNAFAITIIYVLVVKRELKSFIHIIKNLKGEFESFFDDILININRLKLERNERKLFKSFDLIIDRILQGKRK